MSDPELRLYYLFLGNSQYYRIKFHDGTTREGVPWTGSIQGIHDPDPKFILQSNDGSQKFLLRAIAQVTKM